MQGPGTIEAAPALDLSPWAARSKLLTRMCLCLAGVSVLVSMVAVPTYGLAAHLVNNLTFVAVGTLIVRRRPGNVVGLLSMAHGSLMVSIVTLNLVALRLAQHSSLDAAGIAALVSAVLFPFSAGLQVPLFLAFPDRSRPTPAARWYLRVWELSVVVMTGIALFARPTIIVAPEIILPHPFVGRQRADDLLVIADISILVTVLLMFGTMPVLIRRWRRGGPIERRQIGWLGLAFFTYTVVATVNTALQPLGSTGGDMFLLVDSIGIIIPLAMGVAILRFHLYDIDVIVTKTMIFLGLAAVITVVYATVIGVTVAVVGAPSGGFATVPSIVATVVVAVLFEPVRGRLQRWANRVVYGERATRHEVLARTSAALADASSRDHADQLAALLARGTGADIAALWISDDGGFRPVGGFPTGRVSEPIAALPARTEVADHRLIEHRGELLGAITIVKPRTDPVSPADGTVLDDVAAVATLHLRRLALTEQLEARIIDVRRSRRGLLEAQDAERRRLERDLHDGAQQHVVALNVKLGVARTLATRSGHDELAALVDGLADDARRAVVDLRAVAHGIFPPLLASDGLATALGTIDARIPIDVRTDGLGRYDPEIEQSAYFAVAETLERVRFAGAERATVTARPTEDAISIEIEATRIPSSPDLSTVVDRLEAFGGSLDADPTAGIVRVDLPTMAAAS
ncbi:MAG: hypothetical protein KDB37_10145 [Ilumatobacter sp.]|nr:hypothetical protein [Ilumatobacter sp.]